MLTILVADDNPISLEFLSAALRQLGCACVMACDGADAVSAAEKAAFQLILLDACMPVLDGAGALGRIRSGTGPSCHVPALATTAATEPERHADLIAAGFAAVLIKPTSVAALATAIDRYALRPHGEPAGLVEPHFDAAKALAAVGGDGQIVVALRGLLLAELERLPAEMLMTGRASKACSALAERMHRLQASAGFCGAVGLERAARELEHRAKAQTSWPTVEVGELLDLCRWIASELRQPGPG